MTYLFVVVNSRGCVNFENDQTIIGNTVHLAKFWFLLVIVVYQCNIFTERIEALLYSKVHVRMLET